MAFVVDASALVFALTDPSRAARGLLDRLGHTTVHAPHLIDAEIGAVLRRKVYRGEMDGAHAVTVLFRYPPLVDHRYEQHGFLASLAWRLRENLSFYDALYVGLAVGLGVELVTLDAALATVPGVPIDVTLVGSGGGR